jgi:predicted DNA-binding transcriptional regulator AlpA
MVGERTTRMNFNTTSPSPADRRSITRPERAFAAHDFLSEKEVAAVLGIASGTLRNHRSLGTGPRFVKFGRLVRYRWFDVESFIAASTEAA